MYWLPIKIDHFIIWIADVHINRTGRVISNSVRTDRLAV